MQSARRIGHLFVRILPLFLSLCAQPTLAQSLTGLWQVSNNGKAWQSVRLPTNLHVLIAPSERMTLRKRIDMRHSIERTQQTTLTAPQGDSERRMQTTKKKHLGWRTGIVSDGARFYANDVLLNPAETDTLPSGYDRDHLFLIDGNGEQNTERDASRDVQGNGKRDKQEDDQRNARARLDLRIEFRPFFAHEYGLLRGDPVVADFAELSDAQSVDRLLVLLLPCFFLLLAIYYASMAVLYRGERSALPLSVFLMLLALYLFQRSDLKYGIGMPLLELKRIEYITLMLLLPSLLLFFRSLFRRRPDLRMPFRRLWQRIDATTSLVCSLTLLIGAGWMLVEDDIRLWDAYNTTIVQPIVWPVLFLLMMIKLIQHWRISRPLFVGIVVALIGTLLDMANHQGWIQSPPAAPISLLAFVGSLSLSQVERSVRLRASLARLNAELETKVEDRTQELRHRVIEVSALKEQQDGDYYLTSLVLRPLSCRNGSGGNKQLTWSSFTKQKKRFQFRERSGELGGDINIIDLIRLRGKEYLVFLNADAMGKSIQGAGGAVVIGTVLGAAIQRTHQLPELFSLYPEEWLRRSYEDLQNVFHSFNGSMMASAVLGLIDASSGSLYHWNAEHPPLILVRDDTVQFIQPPAMLYRLGAPLPAQDLRVHVMRLQPNDILYAGTDGRDDLLVDGRIASDPKRILDIVRIVGAEEGSEPTRAQESNGSAVLQSLVRTIEEAGCLTDDIALLRFHFVGRPTLCPRILRRRAATLLNERRWKESLPMLENYLEMNPSDERSLRVGIRIARRLGHPLAERWSRRLRLRDSPT